MDMPSPSAAHRPGTLAYNDAGAKASAQTLLSITWSLFGAATLLLLARLHIRLRYSGRWYPDDALAVLATTCLLAHAVVVTLMLDCLYAVLELEHLAHTRAPRDGDAARLRPRLRPRRDRPAGPADMIAHFLRYQLVAALLFWTCIWAVKASFLAYFKRLTRNLRAHVVAWYVTAGVTALAYCACVITYPVACSSFGDLSCLRPERVRLLLTSLKYSTAIDVLTDVMIIALPLTLAWRVRLPLRTKLALAGVLSLGGLVAVFGVVRIVVTNPHNGQPEVSWLSLWSSVEAGVACIVSNLAPFKVMFHRSAPHSSSERYWYAKRRRKEAKPGQDSPKLSDTTRSGNSSRLLAAQTDSVAELKPAHVPRPLHLRPGEQHRAYSSPPPRPPRPSGEAIVWHTPPTSPLQRSPRPWTPAESNDLRVRDGVTGMKQEV